MTHHMEPGEFGEGVNLTDKPQEALPLTRPIMGIENRTPAEVFDIMCDRIKSAQGDIDMAKHAARRAFYDASTGAVADQLEAALSKMVECLKP